MSLLENNNTRFVPLPQKLDMQDAMEALRVGLGYKWIRLTLDTVALGMPPDQSLPDLIAVKTEFVTSASEEDVERLEAALKAIAEQNGVIP